MVEIKIFQENHSEPESLKRLASLLTELPRNSVVLYHEALPRGNLEVSCESFSSRDVDFDDFWSEIDLQSHWAPSWGYRALYKTADELGCEFRCLDQDMKFRNLYAGRFLKWTRLVLDTDARDDIAVSEFKAKFEGLRGWISGARELYFAQVVAADIGRAIQNEQIPVVITHPGHVNGVKTNLGVFGLTNVGIPDYEQRVDNGRREDEIQRAYAKKLDLLNVQRDVLPLVPAVVMAFDAREKLGT